MSNPDVFTQIGDVLRDLADDHQGRMFAEYALERFRYRTERFYRYYWWILTAVITAAIATSWAIFSFIPDKPWKEIGLSGIAVSFLVFFWITERKGNAAREIFKREDHHYAKWL